jgi:hypothetical protein
VDADSSRYPVRQQQLVYTPEEQLSAVVRASDVAVPGGGGVVG